MATNSVSLLEPVNMFYDSLLGSEAEELTPAQRESLERGLEQADRGETISHEEMRRQIDELLGE